MVLLLSDGTPVRRLLPERREDAVDDRLDRLHFTDAGAQKNPLPRL